MFVKEVVKNRTTPRKEMVAWESGRVLSPSPAGSGWWDAKCVSGPVVLQEPSSSAYRMYYYGRDSDNWNMELKAISPNLPTGRIGLALSTDGISFHRHRGPLQGGAVLDPSNDKHAFDCVQVAVSDATHDQPTRTWRIYYNGGGLGGNVVGFPFLPGVALSSDGVSITERKGPLLAAGGPGEWDERGVSWPRIFTGLHGQTLMTYHCLEAGGFFSAGIAVSQDGGLTWEKTGKVLTRGDEGSWDDKGVSVRHVVRVGEREYVMFYEGSKMTERGWEFAIGMAVSEDGVTWRKDEEAGDEPGGPVLRPRKGMDVWDNRVVGTPYVVVMESGEMRMYYLGRGEDKECEGVLTTGIGLAVSHVSNFRSWKRHGE